jgi:hypothetical protein
MSEEMEVLSAESPESRQVRELLKEIDSLRSRIQRIARQCGEVADADLVDPAC